MKVSPDAAAGVALLAGAVPMALAPSPERGAPAMALLRSLHGRLDWRGGRARRAVTAARCLALAGGWFELPLQPLRKREAEVPSHHRSAFRKREALRVAAESILLGALGAAPEASRQLVRHRSAAGAAPFGQGAFVEAS